MRNLQKKAPRPHHQHHHRQPKAKIRRPFKFLSPKSTFVREQLVVAAQTQRQTRLRQCMYKSQNNISAKYRRPLLERTPFTAALSTLLRPTKNCCSTNREGSSFCRKTFDTTMKPPAALHRRSLRRNTRRQTITAQNKTKQNKTFSRERRVSIASHQATNGSFRQNGTLTPSLARSSSTQAPEPSTTGTREMRGLPAGYTR